MKTPSSSTPNLSEENFTLKLYSLIFFPWLLEFINLAYFLVIFSCGTFLYGINFPYVNSYNNQVPFLVIKIQPFLLSKPTLLLLIFRICTTFSLLPTTLIPSSITNPGVQVILLLNILHHNYIVSWKRPRKNHIKSLLELIEMKYITAGVIWYQPLNRWLLSETKYDSK